MGLHQLLAKNIKELRKRNNLTQAELAEKCGISTTFMGEIETEVKYPSPKTFELIASALNVNPYVLLLPNDIILNEIDRSELLRRITEDFKNAINDEMNAILRKYIKKD